MPDAIADPTPIPISFAFCTGLCLLAQLAGMPLNTGFATTIACGAILVIGLPHGTLDLDTFQQERPEASASHILLLYLGFAIAMAAAWLANPAIGFVSFYVLAALHFSEDWSRAGSAFLGLGVALAMLALSALTHQEDVTRLFGALAGPEVGALIVNLLRLVAPVSALIALTTMGLLWCVGARSEAIGGSLMLVAMALLPPVVGFALFFCLFHSPRHLRDSVKRLPPQEQGRRSATIVLLTLAGLGLAATIYGFGGAIVGSERIVTAVFMTLSILTLPHMAVPLVLRAVQRRAATRSGSYAGQSPC